MLDRCEVWAGILGKPEVVMGGRARARTEGHELQDLDAGHYGLGRLGSPLRPIRAAGDER